MILQPQATGARTGRVTAAEREASRGHAGVAILLPPDSLELAWSLERRLFDQGFAVYVVHRAADWAQAVRTAVDAGLVTVIAPAGIEDIATVRGALPAQRLAEVVPTTGTTESVAREILNSLQNTGRLGLTQGPLTGGAGI